MLPNSEDSASQPFFAALSRRLSKQAFETWFRPLRITRSDRDGVIRIAVPNPAVRDWILSQYSNALNDTLNEINLDGWQIEWATPQSERAKNSSTGDKTRTGEPLTHRAAESPGGPGPEAVQPPEVPAAPLNEKYTFGRVVVASCKRLAHAAALAV